MKQTVRIIKLVWREQIQSLKFSSFDWLKWEELTWQGKGFAGIGVKNERKRIQNR
jgi:hypothetical protein